MNDSILVPAQKNSGTPDYKPCLDAGDVVPSGQVLRGRQELRINHGDSIYTLRITRQGKLILTK